MRYKPSQNSPTALELKQEDLYACILFLIYPFQIERLTASCMQDAAQVEVVHGGGHPYAPALRAGHTVSKREDRYGRGSFTTFSEGFLARQYVMEIAHLILYPIGIRSTIGLYLLPLLVWLRKHA